MRRFARCSACFAAAAGLLAALAHRRCCARDPAGGHRRPAGSAGDRQRASLISNGPRIRIRAVGPTMLPMSAARRRSALWRCSIAACRCTTSMSQKALNFLRPLKPAMTYPVSLQTMVLCLAEPEKDFLTSATTPNGSRKRKSRKVRGAAAWAYPGMGGGDNSNSQFALLALYEAERAGVPRADETWGWRWTIGSRPKTLDGSFSYYKVAGTSRTPGFRQHDLRRNRVAGDRVRPALGRRRAGRRRSNPLLRQPKSRRRFGRTDRTGPAMARPPRIFTIQQNPNVGSQWHYYFLYGVERIGRMTARRFIGGHDWYREGAAFLVSPAEPTTRRPMARLANGDPKPIRTSRPALPCCSSAKGAGRF